MALDIVLRNPGAKFGIKLHTDAGIKYPSVSVSEEWKTPIDGYVMSSGAWKKILECHVLVSSEWKELV